MKIKSGKEITAEARENSRVQALKIKHLKAKEAHDLAYKYERAKLVIKNDEYKLMDKRAEAKKFKK